MNDNQNKMSSLLDLVKEQVEVIAYQKGEVPQLYIDMAKENLIKLYEEIHLLEKLKKEEKVIVEEKIEIEAPKEVAEQKKVEIELEIPIQIKQEIPEIKLEMPKGINTPTEKKAAKKVVDSNDLFESQLSIGEKLQAQQEPALVDKFQEKQIQDIRSAIGINEKFLFINELFGGNMQKYNHSIEKLDFAATKEEAAQIIGELDTEFNWDQESEARQKLLLFIDRRY